MRGAGVVIAALAFVLALVRASNAAEAEIIIEDVARFYAVFDAANGKPAAEALQRDYLDKGTDGVRQFIPNRIISAEALAKEIAEVPEVYAKARACAKQMPAVRRRLKAVFVKLAEIHPEATFPPVTILVGRNNSGGTTGASGVLIGLEVVCRSDHLQANLTDRFVHLIAHEYGHIEQGGDDETGGLLVQVLREGGAELIAELASGQVSNVHLQAWTKGHEKEIEEKFLADIEAGDRSKWLYNGVGTPERPGDLGYWVGWRIAKSYYQRAKDKRAAVRAILKVSNADAKAFLAESGWSPGMILK